MTATFPAIVVSVGKNAAWVALDGEAEPRVADLKRATGKRRMLVPGDRVDVRVLEDGRALVETLQDRSFVLERRTVEGRSKTMAANLEMLATVTSLASPPPRLRTLDQLLAFAQLESLDALVILTKPDLGGPETAGELAEIYRALDYRVVLVNPKSGENMPALRTELDGRRSLLCGVSGVGKSSIFRALGGTATVGEVSRRGIGKQTTTTARLYRFPDGFLIDSPGVAEFGLGAVTPPELVEGFRELTPLAQNCRFTDCSHLREPGCAVRRAVEEGRVSGSRYASYRQILGAEEPAEETQPT